MSRRLRLSNHDGSRPNGSRPKVPRPGMLPAILLGAVLLALGACSSDPPPTMLTVKKLVDEDRMFDALKTLIPLAQGGDAQAQYELAGFYHYGYVGANDFTKAMKWYRASARQGYADSMVGLSVMYLGGQGVAKDPREAFVWLNLAAQYMPDKRALARIKRVRDDIGKGLTKDDIAYAKAETILLQPESTSIQPNEAESIDHLDETLTAPVASEPLQNVPPDTGAGTTPAVPEIQLQNALPAPSVTTPATPAASIPGPVTTTPATTGPVPTTPVTTPSTDALPATTTPATAMPATTTPATTTPATTPATTAPATVIPPPPQATGSDAPAPEDNGASSPGVQPVPEF